MKKKYLLITGASGTIGLTATKHFLREGHLVLAHYNSKGKDLHLLKKKYKDQIHIVQGDLSHEKGIQKFSQNLKLFSVKTVIHCLGSIPNSKAIEKLTYNDLQKVFQVNTFAPFLISQFCIQKLKTKCVIHLSSIGVKFAGSPTTAHYSASKAALEALTKSLAKTTAKQGVRVLGIRVGVIDSPIHKKIKNKNMRQRVKLIPMGRAGSPQEIVDTLDFLMSDGASYITNEVITVAGGE